jgi:hypothetical protein
MNGAPRHLARAHFEMRVLRLRCASLRMTIPGQDRSGRKGDCQMAAWMGAMAIPQWGQKTAPVSMGPPQAGHGVSGADDCQAKVMVARIWPEM